MVPATLFDAPSLLALLTHIPTTALGAPGRDQEDECKESDENVETEENSETQCSDS